MKAAAGAAKHSGAAAGKRAVDGAANARMVAETIARTHTRQAARAASRSEFLKARAGEIKIAAEEAAREGARAGGRQQLKGHFIEALDVKTYNAKNRLTPKSLVARTRSTNPGYDASRFIDGKFAGGVQQKSSAAGTKKAIAQMEKIKPGSARKGVLRVPRDQVSQTRRQAAGRIKEVKAMEFTSKHAGSKLDKGLGDLAKSGSRATSAARAAAKGAAVGAVINVGLGSLTDAGPLKRGEIDGRDFAENRALDATEGASVALAGIAASGVGGAAGTAALGAALGTSTGAAAAASVGATGSAIVGAISGMGSVGAVAGGVLGGVTVASAAPAVVGGLAVAGSGVLVSKGYKRVRKRLTVRQEQRRQLTAATRRPVLPAAELDENGEPIGDAEVVGEIVRGLGERRGRTQFSDSEIVSIQDLLVELRDAPAPDRPRFREKLRRLGFYLSDWALPGEPFAAEDLNRLVAQGLICVGTSTSTSSRV